jgi:hypothetical protein
MVVDRKPAPGAGPTHGWRLPAAIAAPFAVGALLLLLPGSAWAGGASVPAPGGHGAMDAVRWGFVVGLVLELIFVVILKKTVLTVVIGKDGRVSTSKTIAVVWTFVVAAGLLALVYADLLNHPEPLNATNASGVVGQYALLFGGPLGAAILAKAIVTGQVNEDPSVKPPAESAALSDLVVNDAGDTDLGDLQYVLFNAVALVFVVGTLMHAPASGLPHIPDVLLGLTSVSAAGYVGKKMLPNEPMSAELAPSKGPAEEKVIITVRGLPATTNAEAEFWVRFGPEDQGDLVKAQVAEGLAHLETKALNPEPLPAKPVTVTIVPEAGTLLSAGSFEYVPKA